MNRSYAICLAVAMTACAATAPQPVPRVSSQPPVVVPLVPVTALTFDAKCGVPEPAPIGGVAGEHLKGVTPARPDPRRPLVMPDYPPSALRAYQSGTVYVNALITETGAVEQATLRQSSGFVVLDNAAMRNARNWQLLPARHQEKPVCMWVTFPVIFRVENDSVVESKEK